MNKQNEPASIYNTYQGYGNFVTRFLVAVTIAIFAKDVEAPAKTASPHLQLSFPPLTLALPVAVKIHFQRSPTPSCLKNEERTSAAPLT